MESAPKRFLVETVAEADKMSGEDQEIDENDDSVADPPQADADEGVKRKTGSRGGERNRKFGPCFWNGCGRVGAYFKYKINHRRK